MKNYREDVRNEGTMPHVASDVSILYRCGRQQGRKDTPTAQAEYPPTQKTAFLYDRRLF